MAPSVTGLQEFEKLRKVPIVKAIDNVQNSEQITKIEAFLQRNKGLKRARRSSYATTWNQKNLLVIKRSKHIMCYLESMPFL